MKTILLIGLGRFGFHTAMKLNELRHEVLAIDRDEQRVDSVLPYVTNAQIGDSTSEEFLATLGVDNFDVCIVTIGNSFQASLETTALLKDMGARQVVARAFSDVHAKFLLRNGADSVVYPERQLAEWTAIRYSSNHILDYIELDDEHSIVEVTVPEHWIGHTVGDLNVRRRHNISILALKRGRDLNLNINSDTVLSGEESMLVLGELRQIQKCFRL